MNGQISRKEQISRTIKDCFFNYNLYTVTASVVTATAMARLRGEMEILIAIPTLIMGIAIQIAINFFYKYYDAVNTAIAGKEKHKRTVAELRQDKITFLKEMSITMAIVAIMASLTIIMINGMWIMLLILIPFFVSLLGVGTRRPTIYTYFSPTVPFLFYGILGCSISAFLQLSYDNPDDTAWYYMSAIVYGSTSLAFMASSVKFPFDVYYNKTAPNLYAHNFTGTFGLKSVVYTVFTNGIFSLALMVAFAITELRTQSVMDKVIFLLPSILAFGYNTAMAFRIKSASPEALYAEGERNSRALLIYSILLLVACYVIGDPDRSRLIYIYSWL